MGGAASAVSAAEVKTRGDVIIQINKLHKFMRLFQHNNTGEVIVLINQDIAGYLGAGSVNDWFEVSLSKLQEDYFTKMKIVVSAPEKIVTVEEAKSLPFPTPAPTAAVGKGPTTANNTKVPQVPDQAKAVPKPLSPRAATASAAVIAPTGVPLTAGNTNGNGAKSEEPDFMKRLKALKVAAMDGYSVSLNDNSTDFSGRVDYNADSKPPTQIYYRDDGRKPRSINKPRKFTPIPYYPALVGCTDAKGVAVNILAQNGTAPGKTPRGSLPGGNGDSEIDDLHLHSFSAGGGASQKDISTGFDNSTSASFHRQLSFGGTGRGGDASHSTVVPKHQPQQGNNPSSRTRRRLNLTAVNCPFCNTIFYGSSSKEAIDEHIEECNPKCDVRDQIDFINRQLKPVSPYVCMSW